MVGGDGEITLSARPFASHNGGRRRKQRLAQQALEDGVAEVRGRSRAEHLRLPLPVRHKQVEQDRAPDVFGDLDELAGTPLTLGVFGVLVVKFPLPTLSVAISR